jgi:hypothetical protein
MNCEWTDRYPYESCPTRILNPFTGERLQFSSTTSTGYDDGQSRSADRKEKRRIYDLKNRSKKAAYDKKRSSVGIRNEHVDNQS